jgi:hypothetical protein
VAEKRKKSNPISEERKEKEYGYRDEHVETDGHVKRNGHVKRAEHEWPWRPSLHANQ